MVRKHGIRALLALVLALGWAAAAGAQAPTVTEVAFEPRAAEAVRLVIRETRNNAQPAIDELEVYAPGARENLALAEHGAKASASTCIEGYPIHQIPHLNDGKYGNSHSWISAEPGGGWAQVTLPERTVIGRVVFSRDRAGHYTDRRVSSFEIHVCDAGKWRKVKAGELFISDPNAIPNPTPPPHAFTRAKQDVPEAPLVQAAFLHEEYAWLKSGGRADLHPVLSQPRYKMERPGPRHIGDDRVPLPPLAAEPALDGDLGDSAWQGASSGMVRVVSLESLAVSPLVEHRLLAGRTADDLYLAIELDRLLSGHIAVVSGAHWENCGVVAVQGGQAVFKHFANLAKGECRPPEGALNADGTVFEVRLPLAWFPGCAQSGLRVGLGMGGKYTAKQGRPVNLAFSPVSVAQAGPYRDGAFPLRIGLPADAKPIALETNAPGFEDGISLSPGETKTVEIPAESGALGPEFNLDLKAGDNTFLLHLLRYAPAARALDLGEALAARLAEAGCDVARETARLDVLREQYRTLLETAAPGAPKERRLLEEARLCKRGLFYKDPALAPLQHLLFVKRHPFNPSHNYSVILDGHWRPGGAVCRLEIPQRNGSLRPEKAQVISLFEAGEGVARTPMADFECNNVYFGYQPTQDGHFHLYRVGPEGGAPAQLTDGPFHDYWPCPLPDGGIAFISTRCKRRFLCWRPQAATMHRMDADGSNIRLLSFANLTEWAPSVMDDGRIIWTRSEYQDKAADFGHTLWAMRPDGTHPELVFGNTITKTNGYANGRYMPGRNEVACTLISHFGDLNGPIALLDIDQGRFNPDAITSITPEVFWPGGPPTVECFRDPLPISEHHVLCAHAAPRRFDLYVLDRFGNRELLFADPEISSMCPTLFAPRPRPPVLASTIDEGHADDGMGTFILRDVYEGLEPQVKHGEVKWLAVSTEETDELERLPTGEYREDHEPFQHFYASPSDVLAGPYGWPTYAVKGRLGLVPVEADGSAYFKAPSGKVLYFHVLDDNFNELQRMRSVVQVMPGESRSCTGCHENRKTTSTRTPMPDALDGPPHDIAPPPWGAGPFSFERVVQPVLDANCVRCHHAKHPRGLDFSARLDAHKIPAAYRTLISKGLVHYADWTWSNPDVCHKAPPRSLGTVKSKLWKVLEKGHHDVALTQADMRAIKTWVDLNCPLWADYVQREKRTPITERWARKVEEGK